MLLLMLLLLLLLHPAFINDLSSILKICSIDTVVVQPRILKSLRFYGLVLIRFGIRVVMIGASPILLLVLLLLLIIPVTIKVPIYKLSRFVGVVTLLVRSSRIIRLLLLLLPVVIDISYRSIIIDRLVWLILWPVVSSRASFWYIITHTILLL